MKLCNIHIKDLIILSVPGTFKGFKNWQKVAEIFYQYLVHDRAGEGNGSILDLTTLTVLHACSQRVNSK